MTAPVPTTQTAKTPLPAGPLLTWYGDDFTGSAAVMEVLQFAGLPSVLFLDVPTEAQAGRFEHSRGIGIAGTARSRSPAWMQEHLPASFEYLKRLDAPVTLYKICSTLDSSPEIGSIGAAIEVARDVFNTPWIPLFAAAPAMRRYQAFGHFFASAPGGVFRLDRHPVMSRHPVTPMAESDVNRHLGQQTSRRLGLIDLESLIDTASAHQRLEQLLREDTDIITLDTVTQADLRVVGELIWRSAKSGMFAAGSQGIAYALVAHWQAQGLIPVLPLPGSAGETELIVVVSGSVSATTQRQIEWALDNGFTGIALQTAKVARGGHDAVTAIDNAVAQAMAAIKAGQSPIIYTACGPDDPAVKHYREAIRKANIAPGTANQRLGQSLGTILDQCLQRSGLRRAVISGGDTSGYATRQLSIHALTAIAPTIPGAALFQAHSDRPDYDGLQLALKGGQMGTENYFDWIRRGGG